MHIVTFAAMCIYKQLNFTAKGCSQNYLIIIIIVEFTGESRACIPVGLTT